MRKRKAATAIKDPAFNYKTGQWDFAALLNELQAKKTDWLKPKRTVRSPEELLGDNHLNV